jgi:hypothetical protein
LATSRVGPSQVNPTIVCWLSAATRLAYYRLIPRELAVRLTTEWCNFASERAEYVEDNQMGHMHSAPLYPKTRGRIERWRPSLNTVTPANACFGRAPAIIKMREWIKRQTIEYRRLKHCKLARAFQQHLYL